MQIKQAVNSWQQLAGLLLPNSEKSYSVGMENKEIMKKNKKIHSKFNGNRFLKNYREDPN